MRINKEENEKDRGERKIKVGNEAMKKYERESWKVKMMKYFIGRKEMTL